MVFLITTGNRLGTMKHDELTCEANEAKCIYLNFNRGDFGWENVPWPPVRPTPTLMARD